MNYKNPLDLSQAMQHKRFEYTPEELANIKSHAKRNFMLDNYELEDIDIDQIAQDNDLDNDKSMADRRPHWWGHDINKYTIKPDVLKNSMYTDPIRIRRGEDGKLWIADGHHRLKALRNMGYTTVPAFVRK